MRAAGALLALSAARARRRAGLWLLPTIGIAVAVAFAGVVDAEGTIAGDQAARSALAAQTPLARAVRVTWSGPVTPALDRSARAALHGLGSGVGPDVTEVLLLNPVRLSGTIVRPAALSPLSRWVGAAAAGAVGPCVPGGCPMLATGPRRGAAFSAFGVRLTVNRTARLSSAVPLGFAPGAAAGFVPGPPVLVTGDLRGLQSLPGLSGIYRTYSWVGELDLAHLNSWQLAALEQRLEQTEARLEAANGQSTFTGPFAALDDARTQADAAPRRLLLVGGGAAAVLAIFIVLAAGGLRDDQRRELERLQAAGATGSQCALFVLGESAAIALVSIAAGVALALGVSALLATSDGVSAGGALAHSLLRSDAVLAGLGGWVAATALLALSCTAPIGRLVDLLAAASLAALIAVLAGSSGETGAAPLLLAPLCCLAAAVLVARAVLAALHAAGRAARRGPIVVRLGLVALARAPGPPALAIAFVTVSVGLAGFALAYRATLLRGTADQAAYQVPLDATVSPASNFARPLQLAPLARWQALAGRGTVLPVRTTYASYVSGAAGVTVPALGVPAAGLTLIHGWRTSDGSAPLAVLARRLRPPGPALAPGPMLPSGGGRLTLGASAPGPVAVTVTADLRGPGDALRRLALGTAAGRPVMLHARTPPGAWEVAGFELDEPAGEQITNGHQNGENPAAATQASGLVTLGPLSIAGGTAGRGDPGLRGWSAVGAASSVRASGVAVVIRFSNTGSPGLVRPRQPSDGRPVPVLVDPQTAAAATSGGRLALDVDGLSVTATVAGVLRRFPTVPAGSGGFVIADEATLAGALDAQLPGQGAADELWIAGRELGRLRTALRSPPLSQLGVAFRAALERAARSAPIARGVLGTLLAATAVAAALTVLGLLATLLGPGRDRRAERDYSEQGLGPRAIRAELQVRIGVATGTGVLAGAVLALLLTRLAVASVRAATVAAPQPPLVTIVPGATLAAVAVGAVAVLSGVGWLAMRVALR